MKGVRLRWLTNACFEIRCCDQVLVTDPCLTLTPCKLFTAQSFEKIDSVLISHNHWDHVSDLPAVYEKYNPQIFCGFMSADKLLRWFHANPSRAYPMFPNQEINMGPYKIKLLYNRHLDIGMKWGLNVPGKYTFWDNYPGLKEVSDDGGLEMSSYLITFENGVRILFWGGATGYDQIDALKGLNPDIAIMQYSKQRIEKLVPIIEAVNPQVLLPHHHDLRKPFEDPDVQNNLQLLREAYKGELYCPKNGEWLEF